MCLAKDQAGVGDGVLVRVAFADANIQNPQLDGTNYVLGSSIVVCAIYPIQSLTGLMQPFLDNRYATTKSAFRIEKLGSGGAHSETGGNEAAPPGKNWDSWCPAA
jgi:hypothetical protein